MALKQLAWCCPLKGALRRELHTEGETQMTILDVIQIAVVLADIIVFGQD
jgi:hypothetical protein